MANPETTRYRPLVNLRDQTLGDEMRYRRIHDAAGESVFSPFALALDVAAESIIFRALEVGVDFSDLWLLDPVSAIKAISADPSLKQSVELADGRRLTGLQLQRELGERALKGAVEQDYLTYEEREWGERWLNLLEDMMVDPQRAIRYVNC